MLGDPHAFSGMDRTQRWKIRPEAYSKSCSVSIFEVLYRLVKLLMHGPSLVIIGERKQGSRPYFPAPYFSEGDIQLTTSIVKECN